MSEGEASPIRRSPVYRRFVEEGWIRSQVFEFLESEFERAGFHRADVVTTPMRDVVTVHVERPGIVIGKGGRRSKRLADVMKKRFGFENPYIKAVKIEEPFLSARVVAGYIARRIMKGDRHKRVAYSALRRVMAAGASGVEIRLSGKFGSDRAREERFRAGVIYRCGEHAKTHIDYAVKHVMLPQGVLGVRVRIARPLERPPDTVNVLHEEIESLIESLREEAAETPVGEEAIETPFPVEGAAGVGSSPGAGRDVGIGEGGGSGEVESVSLGGDVGAVEEGGGAEEPEQGGTGGEAEGTQE